MFPKALRGNKKKNLTFFKTLNFLQQSLRTLFLAPGFTLTDYVNLAHQLWLQIKAKFANTVPPDVILLAWVWHHSPEQILLLANLTQSCFWWWASSHNTGKRCFWSLSSCKYVFRCTGGYQYPEINPPFFILSLCVHVCMCVCWSSGFQQLHCKLKKSCFSL